MIDVVALGEILIDFAQKDKKSMGYPSLQAQPGGAPANFLAALTKFGCKTAMIGKVGDDAFGNLLKKTLSDVGINTENIITSPDFFTTLAFVTIDENGERSFSFSRKPGADTQLSFEEIDLSLIEQSRVFHFGTLSLTHEPARSATQNCIEYARKKGKLISYDPNLRLNLWSNPQSAKEAMLYGLKHADVVKISDEEVNFLWNCDLHRATKIILNDYDVSLVYITMGENGCYFANKNGAGHVDIPKGITPVDTTGAGDIFGGAAMSCLLQTNKMPGELTPAELKKICEFACAAASLSTTKPGGLTSVPDIAETEKLIR